MNRMNILNKSGMLTDEDRKQPFELGCDHFIFKSNLELSIPIEVIPYGNRTEYTIEQYSNDLASFIAYWKDFVFKDLNGFSGLSNVKYKLVGFNIIS